MVSVTLAEIHVYPFKSCAGTAVRQTEIDSFGIVGDRRLMVVDSKGHFVSQRSHPRLALVRPEIRPSSFQITAPGMPELEIPAHPAGDGRTVSIWNDQCRAVTTSRRAASWFAKYLGMSCELVWMPEATVRPVDPEFGRPDDRVSFADGFPFLLLSQASLDHLNDKLERSLGMDRFRPNLVVEGCPPHAEDAWRSLTIGNVVFRVVKPCSRCVVTTVDQATGKVGVEPLATLAGYRRRGRAILFGQNLAHDGPGRIQIGDAVHAQS